MVKETIRRRRTQLKEWIWELWALAGSLLALIAMIALLASFDNKPIFYWNGVTLNALVSILSVAMKAFLLFAASQCIGQWKWILFSRDSRRLLDFEHIDLASRGPLGSLTVLWTVKGSYVYSL